MTAPARVLATRPPPSSGRLPMVVRWLADTVGFSRRPVPPRVASAIRVDQENSEVLVGLVQMGAIALFALLYALTPKAFPPSVPFEPVPWTLGIYAAVTLVRLWLALRRKLPVWFLRLSVVIDITVLMVTIWSFHLQYQSPPSLYLKAPTFAYAFIMIALRALRFEVGLVILAGATAILGWAILIGYALLDPRTEITHSFLAYATSPKLLLGAELDKLLTLFTVTGVLAVVIARARRLLAMSHSEQQAAADLARFFAPDVALQIRSAEMRVEVGQAVFRDAAVLTTDLRGFTRLSTMLTPDETLALLAEYQNRVVPVIQAHRGSIDKYLGDGILASFGATRESRTFAADALAAAVDVLAATAAWREERQAMGQEPVDVGLALASGPLLFGAIGTDTRLEYTVIGEPVNLAAKLEKHTKTVGARAVLPVSLVELAVAQGGERPAGLETLGPSRVAGVDTPVDLVALRG